MISGRAFIDAKYVWADKDLAIMSSDGNEKYRDEYLSRPIAKGLILAYSRLSGFKFEAIYDGSN